MKPTRNYDGEGAPSCVVRPLVDLTVTHILANCPNYNKEKIELALRMYSCGWLTRQECQEEISKHLGEDAVILPADDDDADDA